MRAHTCVRVRAPPLAAAVAGRRRAGLGLGVGSGFGFGFPTWPGSF